MNLNFSTRILFTKFWYQDLNNEYFVTIAFTETVIWEGYMVIGFKSFYCIILTRMKQKDLKYS